MTSQNNPLKIRSPPKVMMKAGIFWRTIKLPMKDQIRTPATKAIPIARGAGHLCSKTRTLAIPPRRPTPLPADKSILPGRITSSIPMASVAVIDSSVVSSERLRALRNCGDTMAKNAQITTSAITNEKSRNDLLDCIKTRLLIRHFR